MYYDEYDPYEMRRRQALEDTMSPDEGEEAPQIQTQGPPPPIPGEGIYGHQPNRPMTWNEQQLSNIQAPRREDYKPGKFARVMQYLSLSPEPYNAPYRHAVQDYKNQVADASRRVALERGIESQGIAERRAAAYETSARARERAASATEAYRQWQEQHQPWQPHTMEEYKQVHPPAVRPWAPQNLQEYVQAHGYHPTTLDEATQLREAGKTPPLTLQDRLRIVDATAAARAKYRAPASSKAPKPATPQQQEAAEKQAMEHVLRRDPSYGKFAAQEKGSTGRITRRIKNADEAKPGFWDNPKLHREKYQQFLTEVQRETERILGQATNQWEGGRVEED